MKGGTGLAGGAARFALPVLAMAAAGGCGISLTPVSLGPGDPAHTVRSTADNAFQSTLTLGDGRQARFRLAPQQGLLEGLRADATAPWSAWRTVYRTTADRCRGLAITADRGTVAVVARWGRRCLGGGPPARSLAAVATGNLTRWDVSVTEGFDGWTRTRFNDDADEVVFWRPSGTGRATLVWRLDDGFARPVLPGT